MMRFDLGMLSRKYRMKIRGVIHVGAHHGQEYPLYRDLGIERLLFFEPLPEAFAVLRERVGPEVELVNKAVGQFNGPARMYVERANQGMSSSVLRPKGHLIEYPGIVFDEQRLAVDMVRLDDYPVEGVFNLMVLDVQGYELEVLKGAERTLCAIDYLVTEVNDAELYEGCALAHDLTAYLTQRGFTLIEETWTTGHWGDALYMRRLRDGSPGADVREAACK